MSDDELYEGSTGAAGEFYRRAADYFSLFSQIPPRTRIVERIQYEIQGDGGVMVSYIEYMEMDPDRLEEIVVRENMRALEDCAKHLGVIYVEDLTIGTDAKYLAANQPYGYGAFYKGNYATTYFCKNCKASFYSFYDSTFCKLCKQE